MLISLEGIQLSYRLDGRPMPVLSRVDLEIERGEMVGILGPSGSGKSTLLYILGCLLKPSSGRFRFAGHDIASLENAQLAELRSREIGFVFQQFHLLPRADVLENVLLPTRYLHGGPPRSEEKLREKAIALLKQVGLESHLKHKPNQLSGGQQQRVAIARALMNDPALILADEPTGNLDSVSAGQVLGILRDIQRSGRTVIIITHDHEVAKRCDRVVTIKDGVLTAGGAGLESLSAPAVKPVAAASATTVLDDLVSMGRSPLKSWGRYARAGVQNLLRNKVRSFLTMLGVTIGIAAVLSTVTLGTFTRSKILESYETLGVNKLVIRAYPRWRIKAKDIKGAKFEGVSQETDIKPMRKLFTEIQLISPVVQDWVKSVEFGGRSFEQARLLGVSPDYFAITGRKFMSGQPFTTFHSNNHRGVCVIGHEIAEKLFFPMSPLHQVLQINAQGGDNKQYSCFIIGVMASQTSNNEWVKPDQQILLPDSFLSLMANKWNSKPNEFDMQIRAGASVEDLGQKIKQFFHLKYGRSAEVHVDSDQILLAQMRKFLNLFAMLLAGVAFISLAVGGIGITNMMLVSVAERFKEIGLRKALGARDSEIRMQFLVESIILCSIAGLAGVVIGVSGYHLLLYLAAQLFPKVQFEWVFNWPAMALSVICILIVGIASGIVPAVRAQKLEVVEALRSE